MFAGIGNGSYQMKVSGLPEGSYKLKIDLCLGSDSPAYPLAGSLDGQITDLLTVTSSKCAIKAELSGNQSRVVDGETGAVIKFDVQYTPVTGMTLNVISQSKGDGRYTDLTTQWSVEDADAEDGKKIVIVKVPEKTQPGTYRLVFKMGDAEFPYNIIVK